MEALSHALAGAGGGMIAMALLYPLENVRTRLQVQIAQRKKLSAQHNNDNNNNNSSSNGNNSHPTASSSTSSPSSSSAERIEPEAPDGHAFSSSPHSASSTPYYNGTVDCMLQVCRREGWLALYSGLQSALLGVGVSSAIYFFYYHLLRKRVLELRQRRSLGALDNLLIAAIAGVLNILCTLPIWVINTRMTLVRQRGRYSSIAQTASTIVREEGVSGLYSGLLPSLILVSNPAIQFLAYEQLVRVLAAAYRRRHIAATTTLTAVVTTAANTPLASSPIPPTALPALSTLDFFLLGAVAKAIATVLTYPYQVVKSRLQSEQGRGASVWELGGEVRRMWEEEGVMSFFSGMNAKLLQTVANSAFMFACYEKLAALILQAMTKAVQTEEAVVHRIKTA